eukprot:1153827-Pelagomonas_calceolata.AAC.1
MTHPQTATVVGELMDRMHTSASSRLIMQNRRTKMRGAEGAAHQSMFQMHARCKTGNIPGGNFVGCSPCIVHWHACQGQAQNEGKTRSIQGTHLFIQKPRMSLHLGAPYSEGQCACLHVSATCAWVWATGGVEAKVQQTNPNFQKCNNPVVDAWKDIYAWVSAVLPQNSAAIHFWGAVCLQMDGRLKKERGKLNDPGEARKKYA